MVLVEQGIHQQDVVALDHLEVVGLEETSSEVDRQVGRVEVVVHAVRVQVEAPCLGEEGALVVHEDFVRAVEHGAAVVVEVAATGIVAIEVAEAAG